MIELKTGEHPSKSRGQAMVEYALIMALLAISFGFAIAATGPAIGNVFCNVVHNLGGTEVGTPGGQCGNDAPDLIADGGDPAKFWATVTWVAGHPQGETPFPTPIRRAPTSVGGGLQTSTYTPTPSDTPTVTNTPTYTNTPTETLVPTAGPSPTTSDFTFTVPFVDQISKPEWWRMDLADDWKAQWYNSQSHGSVDAVNGWPITFSQPKNTTTFAAANSFTFDWSTGSPSSDTGVTATNNFGVSFTRTFQLTQATSYVFSIQSDDMANVYLDGQTPPILWNTSYNGTFTATVAIGSGMHTVKIDYGENSGSANITFSMTPGATTAGTPDVAEQDNSCSWGQTSGTNNPVSVSFMFEANPGQATWPTGQTCYLELRGDVDLSGHANPQLSFWDIWDFLAASNVTAQLQIGKYSLVSGNVDRTAFNWQTIASHSTGSRNYAWTRNEIDLTPYKASLGDLVTFRFVIGSTSPSTPFRWFIDDVQIVDGPTSGSTFTVNKTWNLDSIDQMDDFIFDGDSNRTIQKYGLTNTTEAWRWQLTSTNAHSGMGWDDSPSYNYQNITGLSTNNPSGTTVSSTDTQPRIHFLQFKNPIDMTGVLPADTDGDTGNPLLTFWQAYDIKSNASIRVEYYDTGTSTWTTIPNQGMLIDYSVPTGTSRTNLTMQPVQIDLTNIPNWSTATFKLRFAMYVDGAATQFGEGWYIDDIKLEREKSSAYMAYPFVDTAENATFTATTWQAIGGKWNKTTEKGGALNSATAYSDSPLTQYDPGDTQELQMKYAIDLLHDSPTNTTDSAGRAAAVNPVLTFWHQRSVTTGATFSVEMWTASSNTWTQIWLYNSSSDPFPTEKAWQRVEINLVTAVQLADGGKTWANITSNADSVTNDDDIKIRFRFDSGSSVSADGVYVDEIHIENASTTAQKLWPVASGGNGQYVDSIENVSPLILPGTWSSRWYAGGQWNTTSVSGFYKSSSLALADSPSGNYLDNSFSALEMVPIVDMTSTPAGSRPMLTFWTRYNIGQNASFRVDIAYKDGTTAGTANNYDRIGGWSSWTTQPMMVGVPAPSNVLGGSSAAVVYTWLRGQVDLSSYIGKQIRVRFVASVPSGATLADGQYLDEIAFTYSPSQITVPMVDNAQTTTNWVTEGTWGLASDYFLGSGSSSTDFGSYSWIGTYYDCELMKRAADACNNNTGNVSTTMRHILDDNTDYTVSDPYVTTGGKIGPETGLSQITDINFNWSDGVNRPLSNASSVGTSNQSSDSPLQPGFDDTFVVRWTRTVDLNPGTYSFTTASDDGVNVIISDRTGITGLTATTRTGMTNAGYVINNWTDHGPSLNYGTFTVTAAMTRTLVVEYYENWGGAEIILNATNSSYSFTDSPNTPTGLPDPNAFTQVDSIYPGNSSLMLNGYLNLSAASNPVLSYQRLYDIANNGTFSVEVSTDGGFTWTILESITGSANRMLPNQNWEQSSVSLNSYKTANVMIRFRMDTRSVSSSQDGVYLTDIRVTP
ncbi:MAG: hypothetical protein GC204_19985 [Chloroflexi bacterium]|nr:hypothetical protein [Chloroflexota bacterium]